MFVFYDFIFERCWTVLLPCLQTEPCGGIKIRSSVWRLSKTLWTYWEINHPDYQPSLWNIELSAVIYHCCIHAEGSEKTATWGCGGADAFQAAELSDGRRNVGQEAQRRSGAFLDGVLAVGGRQLLQPRPELPPLDETHERHAAFTLRMSAKRRLYYTSKCQNVKLGNSMVNGNAAAVIIAGVCFRRELLRF